MVGKHLTKEDVLKIKKLTEKGCSAKEVCDILKFSMDTVQRVNRGERDYLLKEPEVTYDLSDVPTKQLLDEIKRRCDK